MIPAAESVVISYLNDHAGLTTPVMAETPQHVSDPWIRVTLLDDGSTDGGIVDRSIAAMLQIDCFAGRRGGIADADRDRRVVREALRVMKDADIDGVVVSGARVASSARIPDPAFEPVMQRYVMTVVVWMHAA